MERGVNEAFQELLTLDGRDDAEDDDDDDTSSRISSRSSVLPSYSSSSRNRNASDIAVPDNTLGP